MSLYVRMCVCVRVSVADMECGQRAAARGRSIRGGQHGVVPAALPHRRTATRPLLRLHRWRLRPLRKPRRTQGLSSLSSSDTPSSVLCTYNISFVILSARCTSDAALFEFLLLFTFLSRSLQFINIFLSLVFNIRIWHSFG